MTFDDARRLASNLPEVEEGTSYGTPALKVRGRSFCRLWSEREYRRDDVDGTEVLVVFCDLAWKDRLIAAADGALFTTPHYDGYGAVLIRLADIGEDDLADHLTESYLLRAPAALRRLVIADSSCPASDVR